VDVEVRMLLPVNQSLKPVAVTVPLVAHRSHPCPSKEIAARSLRNLKGHPVAIHAPPITQREVVTALPFGRQSHHQALHVSVDRTKLGQYGHPAMTAAQAAIAVATAPLLPSCEVTAPPIGPVLHRHHPKGTMGQDLIPIAVLIVQSPTMNEKAVCPDLDNHPPDNGMPDVPKDRIVTSRRSPLAHKPAEIWTVDALPCPPVASIEMNVKVRHALPSLSVLVRPARQIAG